MTWFQQPSNSAASDKCYECGSKSTSTQSFTQSSTAGKQHNNWKTVPPDQDESQSKTVKGWTFEWCGKCKRWTASHNTFTHTSNPPGQSDGQNKGGRGNGGRMANLLFATDPKDDASLVTQEDSPEEQQVPKQPVPPSPFQWALLYDLFCFWLLLSVSFWFGLCLPSISLQSLLSLANSIWFWSAPLSWIAAAGWACFGFTSPFLPGGAPKKADRAFTKVGNSIGPSIRTQGFHKSYPRKLRSHGQFVGKPPTVQEQKSMNEALQLHHKVNKLLRSVNTVNRPGPSFRLKPSSEPKPTRAKLHNLKRASHDHYWDNIVQSWKKVPPKVAFQKKKFYKGCNEDDNFPPPDDSPLPLSDQTLDSMRWSGFEHFEKENDGLCRPEGPPIPKKIKRRQQSHKPYHYEAVPASHHHGFGNSRLTYQQEQAFKRIAIKDTLQNVNCMSNAATLRMALQAPPRFRATLPKGKTFPIIMDSNVSANISPFKEDFIGKIEQAPLWTRIKGITKGLNIEGIGHVMWTVKDTNGQLRCLKLHCHYVPTYKIRLLSTSSFLDTYKPEQICGDHTYPGFTGNPGDPTRGRIEGRVHTSDRTPTITRYDYCSCPMQNRKSILIINLIADVNCETN